MFAFDLNLSCTFLQVVNAYHHLNKFDAYVLRLQNLCGAGHCDKALELLHTIEHQEQDSQDGLPSLAFGAAQETLIWLVESIEDLKDSMEDGMTQSPWEIYHTAF